VVKCAGQAGGTAAPCAPQSADSSLTIRQADVADIDAILALHREAFADKFGSAFGVDGVERGLTALATAWRRQGRRALLGMLVAECQQQVIGTITLRTAEMNQDTIATTTENTFYQMLGLWGTLRSMFVLSLLSHTIRRDEGFITDVAVHAPFRRRGAGRLLLAHAECEARARRKKYLALYVSKANRGAITLYEDTGFSLARVRRSWLTRLFFEQREWWYMRKDLFAH
jgi:ribosomal protein S18 acetylase RimI-like enzyme